MHNSLNRDQTESTHQVQSKLTNSLLKNKLFTYCKLFSGISGFGVALKILGGKCLFALDIHKPEKRIYELNLDCTSLQYGIVAGDIWTVDAQDIPSHHLLVGGEYNHVSCFLNKTKNVYKMCFIPQK